MNDIIQRIRQLMEYYQLNISETALRIGVTQPNLSAILSGKRPLGENMINKFVLSFDINKEWLENGIGDMFNVNSNKIGLRMVITRMERGWTPQQMADFLKIPLSEYKDIESGKILPNKDIIKDFIFISNANPSWIYNSKKPIFEEDYYIFTCQDERQKELITRIETLLSSADMSFSDLLIQSKMKHSELSDFFKSKEYDPNNKVLDKISSSLGANKEWMLSGKGDPFMPGSFLENKCAQMFDKVFKPISQYDAQQKKSHIIKNKTVKPSSLIKKNYQPTKYPAKPFIDSVYAVCGVPSGFSIAIEGAECEKISLPFIKEYDFSIKAKGDSMINRANPLRSIRDGDLVACRFWKSRSYTRWGEVYALATVDGVVIKKIEQSEKEGHIKCVSFNEEEGFMPYDLPLEEIHDWAIVIGAVCIKNWN